MGASARGAEAKAGAGASTATSITTSTSASFIESSAPPSRRIPQEDLYRDAFMIDIQR
jgi:outer membrane biosynthesis protein TonB